MDKKQKKKLVPAVCFVLVCGVVYLGIHYGGQRREQIVLEKQDDKMNFVETDGVTATPQGENATVSPTPERATEIYVHVCGAVTAEGVYVLPSGSRVADGIAAAGGFCDDADTAYHNLASCLADGQKIYVPTREETEGMSVSDREKAVDTEQENAEVSHAGRNGKVNINTAGAEELMTLSGIGEAKAQSILQYREKIGAFQSIEELKNVSGIGDAMFERVKEDIVAE